jgi:hypothetical protein
MDRHKLMQICLDHKSLKLDPKDMRLSGTVNVFDVDMKDHEKDHHLLLMLNGPI